MIKFIFSYIKREIFMFAIYIFMTSLILGIGLLIPYIESEFIDGLVYRLNYGFLIRMIILICIINIGNIVLKYIQSLLLVKLQNNTVFFISNDVINHLKKVSILFLSNYDSAYLSSRISNDSETIVSFFLNNIIQIVQKFIIMIVAGVCLIFICNILFLNLILSLIPIYILIYIILKRNIYEKKMKLVEKQGEFFSVLNWNLRTLKTIKIKVLFEESENLYKNSFSSLFHAIFSFNKISCIFSSLNGICSIILHIIIVFFCGIRTLKGGLTIGKFTLISSYCNMMISAITYYLSFAESYQNSKVSYIRIKEFLNKKIEINGNSKLNNINKIELERITFKYNDNRILFENFTYRFIKGNIYALVGENGTGKSTLLDLILGVLNENYIGNIYYNDKDIDKLDMYYIRKNLIATVEQEPYLNIDTIYNNLVYNINNVDEKLLESLLNKFDLDSKINLLPEKYNTVVNDNIKNLSGGERQKLAIINAILKNSEVIILDEPTSALDFISIDVLKKLLLDLKAKKIIILISHDSNFYDIADYKINIGKNNISK